jgi:hypothetical protein
MVGGFYPALQGRSFQGLAVTALILWAVGLCAAGCISGGFWISWCKDALVRTRRRTDHIGSYVRLRQDSSGVSSEDLKVWDDCDSLDLLCPLEFVVVTYANRRLRGLLASVNASRWTRKDFTERDLFPCQVLWTEFV